MRPQRQASIGRAGLLWTAQRGQAIVWMAVMLPLFLAIVGLAADGGLVFSARRELQNVADSAARAGAQQIDVRAYRESRGRTVVLDQPSARRVARSAVGQNASRDIRIDVEPSRVQVGLSRDAPTSFLRLIGIGTVRVTAAATAEIRHGIERGEP
ncbi:TadE/TadG family type IV pilus assembly protein [Luteitalea sp.]|uniref:TadE/TadG family type IV pilus assembly protein n=1 Tax=Luteitalea sp. TaxID=2004800 RepID=UPI0025C40CFE|nr:TadE/TadG family type IV pilus assembly protein [Luteitalea sp.]